MTVALTLDVVEDRVVGVRVVTNPDKLEALQPARRAGLSDVLPR